MQSGNVILRLSRFREGLLNLILRKLNEPIEELPVLKDLKAVKRFLGIGSYYRRSICKIMQEEQIHCNS